MDTVATENSKRAKIKKAKHQYFKSIFEKYDSNQNGYIELKELQEMIKDDEAISKKLVKKILDISDTDHDGKINYREFVGMVQNKKLRDFFGNYMNNYIRFILPRRQRQLVLARAGPNDSFDEIDGIYEDQYSCCPPPIAMLLISAFELACFFTDEFLQTGSTKIGTGVTAKLFIYNPHNRGEFWRYLTYMFVHIGYLHLVVNLAVQILLGIPLEMIHRWWRVLLVYIAGVAAGSLATSITDPTTYLAGASGGVYAILTAHMATIIMNWNEMSFPGVILFMFLLITVTDVGSSIYNRYWLNVRDHVGYAAHFAGAISGLLVGIWILKNFIPSKKETYLWWFALTLYVTFMGCMIVLNIVWTDHFLRNG